MEKYSGTFAYNFLYVFFYIVEFVKVLFLVNNMENSVPIGYSNSPLDPGEKRQPEAATS